jgi:hypothetical protein
MEDNFELPLVPTEPVNTDPDNLIIFSKPKTGKTTLVSGLPGALILDLENGSDYVRGMKVKANSIDDIKIIGKKIKEAGYPYKFIVVDTITALEEKCIDYAEELYSKSPLGKYWFEEGGDKEKYGNILGLPKGAGYYWLREAYVKVTNYIRTWGPYIIFLGHVKDAELGKEGGEFNALDLDLTGKLKRMAAGKSQAIGYLYRKGNQNILSFITSDKVICGARPEHLSNKQIVLSEKQDDGSYVFHWDQIYLNLKKNGKERK